MKRSVLSLLVAVLLVGGASYAWASPQGDPPPPPDKPLDLPGQSPSVNADGPSGTRGQIGTRNAVIKREYVPLATPCRLYDSRTSGGRFSPSEVRTVPLTKCPAISPYATALDASISAADPLSAGYLRAWANGTNEPNQTVLQWGSTGNTAGATITTASSGIKVRAFTGSTHVVVDVAGYYIEPIYADVLTASTNQFADMYSSTGMVSGYSSAFANPGQIVVSFRRDILYCDIQATAEPAGYIATAVYTSSNSAIVRVTDSNGNWARAYASVTVNC
ncbi:hypothetical protein KSP35_21655 [Aquihabitans sp. G128]|uniref:hypothetical protein n=1 Tax=Aquihabitans sp. G128 TaxID=2849779 RepID=UPI001C2122EF|nr:hypothetical protein [Aquihabitans sp. G128]QXC60892.1 hypothetical protein KSP35_21655 [Aquihabitans sp. G128]